uniref:NBS-LRR type resistance protein-like n=1 Tax=Oryza sativa subsp. japonica TaxID=39947 RepID=Q8GVN3_ORYSJ|nr:NBS-LRR type resistance protein-like [Oryza sativa Japonica Group]
MRPRRSSAARRLGRSAIPTTSGDAASLQPLALHSIHASRRAGLRRSPPPPSPSLALLSFSTPPHLRCKAWNHKEAQIGKCISSLCGHFSGDLVEKIKIEKSEDALFPHGRSQAKHKMIVEGAEKMQAIAQGAYDKRDGWTPNGP